SNVLNKRSFAGISPIVNVWGQTLVGSAALLLAAVVLERGAPARWTVSAAAALAYLAVFGTALTFAGLFWLIPRVPLAVIGTSPLGGSFIRVPLGSVAVGETLSARSVAGGSLILAGLPLAPSPERGPAGAASQARRGLPAAGRAFAPRSGPQDERSFHARVQT